MRTEAIAFPFSPPTTTPFRRLFSFLSTFHTEDVNFGFYQNSPQLSGFIFIKF